MEKFGLAVKIDGNEFVELNIEVNDGGAKVMDDLPGAIRLLANSLAGMIEENGAPYEEGEK